MILFDKTTKILQNTGKSKNQVSATIKSEVKLENTLSFVLIAPKNELVVPTT